MKRGGFRLGTILLIVAIIAVMAVLAAVSVMQANSTSTI
jgi:Tfp pilus assembly protein FimT